MCSSYIITEGNITEGETEIALPYRLRHFFTIYTDYTFFDSQPVRN